MSERIGQTEEENIWMWNIYLDTNIWDYTSPKEEKEGKKCPKNLGEISLKNLG